MYRVIKLFTDLQDSKHLYNVGDTFPRVGKDVTAERVEELSGSNNKQGVPLIALVDEPTDEPEAKEPETAEAETAEPEKPKRGRKKKG